MDQSAQSAEAAQRIVRLKNMICLTDGTLAETMSITFHLLSVLNAKSRFEPRYILSLIIRWTALVNSLRLVPRVHRGKVGARDIFNCAYIFCCPVPNEARGFRIQRNTFLKIPAHLLPGRSRDGPITAAYWDVRRMTRLLENAGNCFGSAWKWLGCWAIRMPCSVFQYKWPFWVQPHF